MRDAKEEYSGVIVTAIVSEFLTQATKQMGPMRRLLLAFEFLALYSRSLLREDVLLLAFDDVLRDHEVAHRIRELSAFGNPCFDLLAVECLCAELRIVRTEDLKEAAALRAVLRIGKNRPEMGLILSTDPL